MSATRREAADRPGGHTHMVDVALDGIKYPADTGFLVYAATNNQVLLAKKPVTKIFPPMFGSVQNTRRSFYRKEGQAFRASMKSSVSVKDVGESTITTARRILVVDDNGDSAESLALLLSLDGNETHIAYDGLEAIQAAATFKPNVMVLDIGLPKLNGYQVARKVRELPSGNQMRLIALTGWTEDASRSSSQAAGFDAHFTKPVDHAALTRLLAEFATVEPAR